MAGLVQVEKTVITNIAIEIELSLIADINWVARRTVAEINLFASMGLAAKRDKIPDRLHSCYKWSWVDMDLDMIR
jgi:hypothetical protein